MLKLHTYTLVAIAATSPMFGQSWKEREALRVEFTSSMDNYYKLFSKLDKDNESTFDDVINEGKKISERFLRYANTIKTNTDNIYHWTYAFNVGHCLKTLTEDIRAARLFNRRVENLNFEMIASVIAAIDDNSVKNILDTAKTKASIPEAREKLQTKISNDMKKLINNDDKYRREFK